MTAHSMRVPTQPNNHSRWGKRAILMFGFLAVATQRFGFGGDGAIQLTALVSVALAVGVVTIGKQPISRAGAGLFGLLILVGTIAFMGSVEPSANSLMLLFATYSAALMGRAQMSDFGRSFMAGAVSACTVGAFLGVAQYLVQSSGHGFVDPVGELPPTILRSGFNSYYGITYFGKVATGFKPNGMIFLEPSFLSLYSALGLVYILVEIFSKTQAWRWWHLAMALTLGAGFAVSASASGLVVLVVAAIPLAVRALRKIKLLLAISIAGAILWSAGTFDAVALKAADTGAGSSTALRLFLPYPLLFPYWQQSPIIGLGPGSTTKIISVLDIGGLQATTTMKALVEYGVLGALVIFSIVGLSLFRSQAPIALIASVTAAWLIPSESLLNSSLVMLIMFGVGQWRAVDESDEAAQKEPNASAPPASLTATNHSDFIGMLPPRFNDSSPLTGRH